MIKYSIAYEPWYGTLTMRVVYLNASSYEHARIKFFNKYGDDCQRIINFERLI